MQRAAILAALFCALYLPRLCRARVHIYAHTNEIIDIYLLYYIYIENNDATTEKQRKERKGKERKGMERWKDGRMEGWKDGRMEI